METEISLGTKEIWKKKERNVPGSVRPPKRKEKKVGRRACKPPPNYTWDNVSLGDLLNSPNRYVEKVNMRSLIW